MDIGETVDEDAIYRRVAWRVLPLLMAAWLFAYVDRVNVGFAKLQMAGELGFSDAVYGFGAGIFFLGYFVFEVPSNIILHRVGARRWIGRIMVTWSLVAGLTAFVHTPLQFYGMRPLLGLAEAGFIPGATLLHGSADCCGPAISPCCHGRWTYSGRPSSSIRFSAFTAIATSVARR